MSFETEKQGLQAVANLLDHSIKKGLYGFDEIEILAAAKAGLVAQYRLLESGLAGVLGQMQSDEEPQIAIAQPNPEKSKKSEK